MSMKRQGSGRNNVQSNGVCRKIDLESEGPSTTGSQGPKQNDAFKEDQTQKDNKVIAPEPYHKTI